MSSLTEAFDALEGAVEASSRPPRTLPTRPATDVEGRSPGDQVRVRLTDGRVSRVDVRDHVLGLDPDEVGDLVAAAVNDALDAHDAALVAGIRAQDRTDLVQLSDQLDTIGKEAQRSLETYLSTMEDMLRRASREANR